MSTGVRAGIDRIREAGDSALLVEVGAGERSILGAGIDVEVNARAIAIARAVRQRAIVGVRDVISTYRSVAVFFDPLAIDAAAVATALHDVLGGEDWSLGPVSGGRTIEVPVIYGGAAGPDLADVAAYAGCAPGTVVERHASREHRVFMLGFLPGFAYMASVDETIAAPRRATPRLRVPAGSVGIAGRQTGIYPCESPGGWQIIGGTALTMFDPRRTPPALFEPGDQVRFVPITGGAVERPGRLAEAVLQAGLAASVATRFVTVLRPGLLTTVQDFGRWGYQAFGVPVSGPMDFAAHRLANAVVGNPIDAATLEATWLGPELRMEQETRVAVAGGDLRATLDRADFPLHAPVCCRAGSVLRFGGRRSGARAYVAFDGGIAVPPVLGSRATHVRSGLGGVGGRAVQAGDCIPLGGPGDTLRGTRAIWPRPPVGGARLRVLPGPQAERFDPSALEALQRAHYTVSPQSDRMGYRLAGGSRVPCAIGGEMISDAAFLGGVQVPPSGDPILLMADRQTTGGYPQLAVVITADLPLAGQLGPGDWVEFDVCGRAGAVAALVELEGKLRAVR